MDINSALKILEFDKKLSHYTIRDIEKRYKKLALKYHPDKNKWNKSNTSSEKFQNLCDAKDFIVAYLKNKSNNSNDKEIIFSEIDSLIAIYNTCHKCQMMSGNGIGLAGVHFILENLVLLIKNKIELYNTHNQKIILLRPTITDLMNDNLFVYKTNNSTHYIPLWHRELWIYENETDIEYLFLSIPVIEQRMCIDEKNNIYIFLEYSKEIDIGGKTFEIPPTNELIHNYHTIYNNGILQPNNNDIYRISSRSNIFIKFNNL